MLILLTNDDGVYSPGLAALERQLHRLGDVLVVAPATEQSGVGHSITYLTPLVVKEVWEGDRQWAWAVEGSPADCVKIAIARLASERPALVVSGINSGWNAGINVLYSGTVAAAIEGASFGITSVAVSVEFGEHTSQDRAARLAVSVIERILQQKGPTSELYNLNMPIAALDGTPELRVVPMDTSQYGEHFEQRVDPFGRVYYWPTGYPPPEATEHETDLSALRKGFVTLTPLDYNLTRVALMGRMQEWSFELNEANRPTPDEQNERDEHEASRRPSRPVVRTPREKLAPGGYVPDRLAEKDTRN